MVAAAVAGNDFPVIDGAIDDDRKSPAPGDSATTLLIDQFQDASVDAGPLLALTVVFHPDPDLIGAQSQCTADSLCIGRNLAFAPHDQPDKAAVIGDPFVSRLACTLEPAKGGWSLSREAGSSALRVNGKPVVDETVVETAALWSGVVINLTDRVLLHARLTRADVREVSPLGDSDLIGVSPAMIDLRARISRLASTDDDVLLLGETGVGKDVAARAVHEQSPRSGGPFVAINMAAVPEELAAASLFGAAKGAYTGADKARSGFFEDAEGGSLFLDEIGDAPPRVQPQLLRALEQREIQVVGGAARKVDVRVIAATELDPDAQDSLLRSSLRHRLATQELSIPPLSDRREDIGLLAKKFLLARHNQCPWVAESQTLPEMEVDATRDTATDTGLETKAEVSKGPAAAAAVAIWARYFESLTLATWPGNVRQLKNVIARLDTCGSVPPILDQRAEGEHAQIAGSRSMAVEEPVPGDSSIVSSMDEEAFYSVWESSSFEVTSLARALGCSRGVAYRRVHASPLCRLASEVPLGELHHALDVTQGDVTDAARQLKVSKRGLEARLRAAGISFGTPPESSKADLG